jgi:hemerythrin-like metal-binding protein
MDDVHREFVQNVQAMQSCTDAEFPAALAQFILHAKAHFGAEDAWMIETNFPPKDCHMDEHAAVMKSAEDVRALVTTGNIAIGRSFAVELVRWFPGHADYLDSALAQWMVKRQHGGKPVVLRRGVSS